MADLIASFPRGWARRLVLPFIGWALATACPWFAAAEFLWSRS